MQVPKIIRQRLVKILLSNILVRNILLIRNINFKIETMVEFIMGFITCTDSKKSRFLS